MVGARLRSRGGLLAVAGLVVGAMFVAVPPTPVSGDHTPDPERVTLMGSLMDELGCDGDWDETCDVTDLALEPDGVWSFVATVPAGAYEYKVRLNGSWDESYGLDGGEANIPLVLLADAELRFTYDHASHRVAVEPAAAPAPTGPDDEALAGSSLRDDLTQERFYFVMADRFANGDPSNDTGGFAVPPGTPDDEAKFFHGLDPTHTGFFHGGDLQGIIDRLDYIEGLGTTAIWLTPSFKNKPVQGVGDTRDAGYHGYWITDYTVIDPHLGTNDDMRTLVDLAHDRGIKVFFDIITNHSADVITYDESQYVNGVLPYVSTADQPYVDANGVPFDDRDYAGTNDFPEVDLDSFPYTPIVPEDEADIKVPAWLNDPTYYHNRGTSTFSGESDTYGDFPAGPFAALDDLWTEHPDVVAGMIDIYNAWVGDVGIDGFRIDTVKHVNIEFWQQFSDGLLDYADSIGNDDFFMFGEVFDANPTFVSRYTTEGRLQAAVDFGFQASATNFARGAPTTRLRDFFASDDWYTDADSNVYSLPTFLGNHDMGRIGSFLTADGHGEDELLARDQVAHTLMYLSRGQPVVYYGDEQGFAAPPDVPGGIGDQRAREDMFPTQVDLYASYDPIGTDATPADDNFDPSHPLYATISELAALVESHPTLADGAQVHRYASGAPGIYAFSRVDRDEQREYVVAVNNDTATHTATFDTFTDRGRLVRLWGPSGAAGDLRTDAEGRVTVEVPPLSAVVYRANRPLSNDRAVPQPFFSTVQPGGVVGGRAEIGVSVPGGSFNEVTFAWRPVGGGEWTVLGTDDNAPYRVFHDVGELPDQAMIEYRAIAVDAEGDLGTAQTWAVVGEPSGPGGGGGGGGPVTQPGAVSVPGNFNDEVGCPADWQPDCPAIDMTLDAEDLVWKKTFEGDQAIPAGQYAYKVAIDDSWDENYGAGAVRDGPNIPLDATGDPITFYYSHATNWITNSIETPHIYVAPGNFQSELGCPGDWQPACMRSWLQDPDGDDVWTFRTTQLPPGNYESKVAQDFDWPNGNWGVGGVSDGPNLQWTVGADEGVEFRFTPPDPSAPGETAPLIEVVTFPAEGTGGGGPGAPDPSVLSAHWLTRDTIAWDLPADRAGWTYRLHHAPEGGLAVDAEAVTGGASIPLTAGADDLPAALAEQFPHLSSFATLELGRKDARDVEELLTQQVVVAAYDELGRLQFANGVQIPGVLDDVYTDAVDADLGVTWQGRSPQLALWAPTATDVDLVVWTGPGDPDIIDMRRGNDGVWRHRGTPSWAGAEYVFDVTVYVPSEDAVVTNRVTDPYSLALTADSQRSIVVDLSDDDLQPDGWDDLVAPELAQPEDTTVYELHVRDFSATDETVPADLRGTYEAFTVAGSDGTEHLARLVDAGVNSLHLLPTYDLGSVPEVNQAVPDCDLSSFGPASPEQQACIGEVRADDAFNWGYDPFHYTTPEGSYATDPDGPRRTLEYREMVQALNEMGLRVVTDNVYNHTFAGGQQDKSVLDRIVPGYYHRLTVDTGEIATSTCCFNTASEHAMMEKLMVDSIVTWATEYKVTGFRFDLMGHHSLENMAAVRAALDELTVEEHGVDGSTIYLYGEGWNFGEVADDARFEQATQLNLAGTGIGSFNDRMRDAVHGGSPFDADPRAQGFGTGLFTDPNGAAVNGDAASQEQRLLYLQDRIKIGLAGNLRDYTFVDRNGDTIRGIELDSTGYAADPSETVNYVDAHDNETLADLMTFKLPGGTSLADRARMNTVAQATTALSQGVSFWHAGTDLLRSKSLDRDSFDSGDWFNRIDWSGEENTFGSGLPPAWRNEDKWPYMEPLLARAGELTPTPEVMQATHERALDLLRLRHSSPLFRLGDADLVQQRLLFPDGGPDQARGVITMHLSDLVGDDLDPQWEEIVVVFNASPAEVVQTVDEATGPFALHPIQAGGADPVVKDASADGTAFTVPARTVAVFVA